MQKAYGRRLEDMSKFEALVTKTMSDAKTYFELNNNHDNGSKGRKVWVLHGSFSSSFYISALESWSLSAPQAQLRLIHRHPWRVK